MADTNTNVFYYYLTRVDGENFIGFVDSNGTAPLTSGTTIEIQIDGRHKAITDTAASILNIPEEEKLILINGVMANCARLLPSMPFNIRREYKNDYERARPEIAYSESRRRGPSRANVQNLNKNNRSNR